MTARQRFFALLQGATQTDVFNPWFDHDPATDIAADAPLLRRRHLDAHLTPQARYLLVGEAAGYQGCKVSGIPFTSERLLLAGAIPRIACPPDRLTSRERPWSEPSATTVWKTLHSLGIASQTVLWNAYPWHPHRPALPHSNRTPTRGERLAGVPVLEALLAALPAVRIFAVGRNAEASLAELGISATALRHPSMGGASQFAAQLRAAIAPREAGAA